MRLKLVAMSAACLLIATLALGAQWSHQTAGGTGHQSGLTASTGTRFAVAPQSASGANTPTPVEEPRPLEPNKPVERDLTGGQTHAYVIQLTRGEYLHLMVDQRGIDVVVSLFSPEGAWLAEVDSPSGTTGLEPVFWVAESDGTYRVQVFPFDAAAPGGKYQIKMDPPRTATNEDQERVLAQREYIEGRAQILKGTEGPLRMAKIKFEDSLHLWLHVKDQERAQQTLLYLDLVHQSLADLLYQQGNSDDALALLREYLNFVEADFGPNSLNTIFPTRDLAALYEKLGQFTPAENFRKKELQIAQERKGAQSAEMAASLLNLSQLYTRQAKYAAAEPLYKQALAAFEKTEGAESNDVAALLTQLGEFYRTQGRHGEAEQAYRRSIAIYEKAGGSENPALGLVLRHFAKDYAEQGRYAEAFQLDQRALAIDENALGQIHPDVANDVTDMAAMFVRQEKYAAAKPLYRRALTTYEKAEGPGSANTLNTAITLLGILSLQGDQEDSDELIQWLLKVVLQKFPEALKRVRADAARKDIRGAQFLLGALYDGGQVVKQDRGEALRWYRAAAENGEKLAYVNLAKMYENGLGVARDNAEAYRWYLLAGPGHADWDAHKKDLAAQLTREQFDEAQVRATEWQQQHPLKP